MNTAIVELKKNGIDLEIEGIPVHSVRIPSNPVGKDFAPNIKDHFIVSGDKLRNGMVVLVEEVILRGFSENSHRDRWALVTDLEVRNSLISFIGIYADGTTVTRTSARSIHWAVMKEVEFSGPVPEDDSLDQIDNDFFQTFYGGGENSPEKLMKFVENLFGPAPSQPAPTDLQEDEGPASLDLVAEIFNGLAETLNQKTDFLDNIADAIKQRDVNITKDDVDLKTILDSIVEEPEEYPETVTSDESVSDSK